MRLVWKLLRKHISLLQLAGFFLANLLGMLIVLLAFQFYRDVKPLFSQDDGIIKSEYLILSKRISVMGGTSSFTKDELHDLERQPFTKGLGAFTASQYKVSCSMGIEGIASFGTQMYFEAVPDRFVDTDRDQWHFSEGDPIVPIILPRNYLAIYNFGFAQSRNLPKLSEGVVSMIDMTVLMRGAGREKRIRGRVVGFTSRLNTILVPEDFIRWSNSTFAPDADTSPTRLILEVGNPADDAIARYVGQHGYDIDEDKLQAGKTTYFLKLVSAVIMSVGLLITALSFFVLMLSIYLLVQKNTEKLRNLMLIGYSPARVCLPYQMLAVGANLLVLLLAWVILQGIRRYYMRLLWAVFPAVLDAPMWPAYVLGALLFLLVSVLNVLAIRRKISRV